MVKVSSSECKYPDGEFYCDGVEDDVQIQNALNTDDDVVLGPGNYYLSAPITIRGCLRSYRGATLNPGKRP